MRRAFCKRRDLKQKQPVESRNDKQRKKQKTEINFSFLLSAFPYLDCAVSFHAPLPCVIRDVERLGFWCARGCRSYSGQHRERFADDYCSSNQCAFERGYRQVDASVWRGTGHLADESSGLDCHHSASRAGHQRNPFGCGELPFQEPAIQNRNQGPASQSGVHGCLALAGVGP